MPVDLSRQISPAAGFRNVPVHRYAHIDMEKVYFYLQNHLDDLEQFARYIALYLEKND